MVIDTASTRRPRSSVGPLELPSRAGPSQPVDVEFRRKHSRQNKEIIAENVRHKTAMKVLNDEIGSLKEELMEVKQINRILSLQMRKMKGERVRRPDTAAMQAIDALIAAMPALHIFRQSLEPQSSPLPVFEAEVSRRNILRNIGMTIGTRPANAGSNLMTLDTMGEDEEVGNSGIQVEDEDAYVDVETVALVRPSSLASPLSMARRRAGNPRTKTPPRGLTIGIAKGSGHSPILVPGKGVTGSPYSQAVSRSPLPLGTRTAVELSVDPPSSPSSPSPVKRTTTSPKKKMRRRRESGLIPPAPAVESVSSVSGPASTSISVSDLDGAGQEAIYDSGTGEDTRSALAESISSSSTASSALTNLPESFYAEESSTSIDDEGKRGRRSRSSVNYKEPSLTKKMRKPDGVPVADMISKRQGSHDSTGDILRQSSGMRRKSVLPKTLASMSQTGSRTHSDSSDVDDIDDCLSIDQSHVMTTPRSFSSGSTLSDPPSISFSSQSSRDESERIPTQIPPAHVEPHSESTSSEKPNEETSSEIVAASMPSLRTSPRKLSSSTLSTQNKARRASTLVSKAPVRTGPAARNRTALADVPEPNRPPRTTVASTMKPRASTSARR